MHPFPEAIYVTRPLLPPLPQMSAKLEQIWESRQLTNCGDQHAALEIRLRDYLKARHVSLYSNGTLGLVAALRALDVSGEVITTPFTFAATVHAVAWNGAAPVFCDIDPETLTIDPERAADAITGRTKAILGVHVFGIPCDVERLATLSRDSGLRLVYDGAHAFGVQLRENGICDFGDATVLSFHSTKLFHSAEGGAVVVSDPNLKHRLDLLRNFGIEDSKPIELPGLNAKMSELHAALGLLVLEMIDGERKKRGAISALYRERLGGVEGLRLMPQLPGVSSSLQYFAILVDPEFGCSRDELCDHLAGYNVIARKYFWPLCSEFPSYRDLPSARPENLPVATRVARSVLCLPFYGALPSDAAEKICDLVLLKGRG